MLRLLMRPLRQTHQPDNRFWLQSVLLVAIYFYTLTLAAASDLSRNNQELSPQLIEQLTKLSRTTKPGPHLLDQTATASRPELKYAPLIRQLLKSEKDSKKNRPPADFVRTKNERLIQTYIIFSELSQSDIGRLESFEIEIEVVNFKLNTVQAWVATTDLALIADDNNVVTIKTPSYARPRSGAFNTEGDAIIRSGRLRSIGFNGSGVKVGIISDGSNALTAAQSSSDLPINVSQYGSCTNRVRDISNCTSATTCNEGTAMAEIIHDIAPGAELAIAAVSTSLEFVQRINELANDFGADIIVDDLGFFAEPYFEDGPLAQAVSALPDNVLYISSAGNSGNIHYEEEFQLSTSLGIEAHSFATNDSFIEFLIPAQGYAVPFLQWNDKFDSPNSNYDLIVVNQTEVVARSQFDQLDGQPPIEALCLPNETSSNVINSAIVQRVAGAGKRLEMFFLGSPAIEYPQPDGSIFGHAGTAKALAVGSINASEPGHDDIAFYSSQGPSRIDFPSIVNRPKPDIIGIDGVMVSGAGGFSSPFFGTSAAAPHVAGVAAQLMSSQSKISVRKVKRALTRGSVDLGVTGFDSTYGHGRVDAILARGILVAPTVIPPLFLLLDD